MPPIAGKALYSEGAPWEGLETLAFMLAYVLAIAVAIGSFTFYLAAFWVPEMHRRQDFFWSGLGLFYAVVLWFCAGRITGAVLLGQVASVALLGGLGWHTLSLRRSLTPELVRTPITWEDLQRWVSRLQHYFKLGALGSGIRALMGDVGRAIATLRRNTAGPYALETPTTDVPPLKRSPAYEFETAPGEGESIPSEFATVASAPRPAAPPPVASTVAAQSVGTSPAAPRDRPLSSPTTPSPQVAKPTVPKAPPRPAAPSPSTAASAPQRSPNPLSGLGLWVGDVVKRVRQPKSARSVIEIPPRSPSIPREENPAAADTPPWQPAKPPTDATDDNWVDVGDWGEEVPAWTEGSIAQEPDRKADLIQADLTQKMETERAPEPPRIILEPRNPAIAPLPVSPRPEDTNWPEDEDTNWPD